MGGIEERIREIVPYITSTQLTALVEVVCNIQENVESVNHLDEIWE